VERKTCLLQANDPQDYPDDGDEEAEPNRFDDQLLEPLRGQSVPPPDNRLSFPYLTLHRSWMLTDRAFGQLASMPQLGELGVAVLFHELRDVVATAPAARLALDRERRDTEVRERVGVVSHASGSLGLMRVRQNGAILEEPR
jgi:hypothetical protein